MRATIPIRTRGPKPVCEPATAVSSVVVVPAPSITTLEEMPTIGSTDVAPEIAEEAVVTHPSKDKEKRQVDHGGNLGPLLSLLYENVIGDKIKGAKILHEESACMGRGEGGMSVALDSKAPCMQIDDSLVVVPTEDSRAKVFAFSAGGRDVNTHGRIEQNSAWQPTRAKEENEIHLLAREEEELQQLSRASEKNPPAGHATMAYDHGSSSCARVREETAPVCSASRRWTDSAPAPISTGGLSSFGMPMPDLASSKDQSSSIAINGEDNRFRRLSFPDVKHVFLKLQTQNSRNK
ncbi:hypothetical protein ACOSQ4_002059 [Xanthoceras sorbifolium]